MKNKLLLSLFLLLAGGARAQTLTMPVTESFETNGEGSRYMSNTFDRRTSNTDPDDGTLTGFTQYWTRNVSNNPVLNPYPAGQATNPPNASFGANASPISIGNVTGSAFWIGEGVRGTNATAGNDIRPAGYLELYPINTTGYTDLQVKVDLAQATRAALQIENDDFLRIQYTFDTGATPNWTTIGQFVGDNSTTGSAGNWRQDLDLDGVSLDNLSAPVLSTTLTTYTFLITPTGSLLRVRIVDDQRGGTEELAFDNIRVLGTLSATAPPVLANIEGTVLPYAEGQAATQITNALTVSDADNTTLVGASVRISSGFVSGQDVLGFVNGSGITGTYNGGTGVLTLTGTATLANYQAALRSVTYQNLNTITATGGNRVIQFNANDGANSSNAPTRVVAVTAALNAPAALPFVEDFSTDGEGLRYGSNQFTFPGNGGFLRTNVNPYDASGSRTTFSNISNGYYWFGENTNNALNPDPLQIGRLITQQVNAANNINLHFQIRLGATSAANGSRFQTSDYFKLYYRTGGSAGTWTLFGSFRGNTTVANGNGSMQQDADPNNPGSVPTGLTLTEALQNVDFALPAALNGQLVDFRLDLSVDGDPSDFAFDLLQVTGTLVSPPTVTTATATSITTTTAVLGGNVTNSGGDAVTDRGVVYSATNTTPTTTDTKVQMGTGTGNFSQTVSGLTPGTIYYVRAYAINSAGTSYGSVVSFTTTPNAPVVTVPANGSLTNNATPTYTGTAQAGSTVTVYVDGLSIGTTTATAGGTFSLAQPTALAQGSHIVYATAQITGSATSANSNTNTFIIDTTRPAVSISSTAGASGSTTATTPIPFTVTFPESVTGFVAGDVTITNGTLSGFSGSGTTYTFTVAPTTAGTVTTVNVPANVAQDAASNGNTAATQFNITYSQPVTATPVVTAPANGSLTNNATPTYTGTAVANATVNVIVDGVSIGTTTATGGGTFSLAQPTNLADGSHNVYATAQSSGSAVSANSNTNTFTVDSTRPTVSISSTAGASGSTTATSPIPFTITFSESVTGFVAGDVTITNGTLSGFSGSGTTYTFTVAPTTAGTVTTVNVPANVAQDAASNGNTAATQFSITYLAPTIVVAPATLPSGTVATAYSQTITASGGTAPYSFAITAGALPAGLSLTLAGVLSGTPTASGTFNFTVTATDASSGAGPYNGSRPYVLTIGSQPVTAAPVVTAPANGSLTNTRTPAYGGTAVANATVTVIVDGVSIGTTTATGAGTFSLAQPTNLADGSHNVYATAQSSGSAVSANSNTNTFTVDATAPTVAISSTAGASGSTTGTSPIPFTITFSESVTGFVAGDVTITNGTLSGFSGSGTTYTFNITPAANGLVTVNVPANVAQDAASNGNTAATQFNITYSQLVTATPVVTAPANGSLTNNATPTYTGTAVANATVTVIVDGVSIGTTTATGAGTFSLGQPTALAQGSHNVYATAQSSGSAVSANSNTNTFTVDAVQPTVVISSTAGASGSTTATTPIPFTITFSEAVVGFVAGDVTVSNGTLSGFSGSGTTYTFSVTPTTAGTVTTVNVAANVAQDAAGNGNTAATQFNIIYTAPVTATTWTGLLSTDWFTAGNWTSGVPTSTLDAVIPVVNTGNYPLIAAGTGSARNFTLSAGATFTQGGGTLILSASLTNNGTFTATGGTVNLNGASLQTIGGSSSTRFWNLTVGAAAASLNGAVELQRLLTLNGNLTTGGNPFTLLSSATATAMVVNTNGVVNGTATVQRYIDPSLNAGLGYRHYSSPVTSTTVADLTTTTFTPVVNPNYNTVGNTVTPFPTVYGYDESRLNGTNATTQNFDYGYFSPGSLTDPLVQGRGYTVNIDAASKVDLVGTLNSGTVPVGALSRGTEANAGWHLLGNPYPSPLNWNVARTNLPTGVIDAVYVFKSSSQYAGTYQFYQNGFGTLPSGLIGSMQGFFVRVSQPVAAFNFLNTWRSISYSNPTFNRPTADTRPAVQLELVDAQGTRDAAFVYFEQGATAGMDDHYDAVKLPNTTGLNLASVAVGNNLAVNGLPEINSTSVTVPLFIGLPASGTYTLHAAQLQNFAAGAQPWLRDLQLNTLTDLSLTSDYTFTMNAANNTPRFELVFGPARVLSTSAALAAQVAVFPNPARSAVSVELPGNLTRQPVTAALVDALGRVVSEQVLPAGLSTHKLPLTNVATGIYTLRLSTSAGIIVKKLIVE